MNCIVSEFYFVYVFYLKFYPLKTSKRQENSLFLGKGVSVFSCCGVTALS